MNEGACVAMKSLGIDRGRFHPRTLLRSSLLPPLPSLPRRLPPRNARSSLMSLDHLIAGLSSGVLTTAALHPVDLVKVRLQVQDGHTRTTKYASLRDAVKLILREEGWRGMYKGVVPAMYGSGLSWGSYFFLYEASKTRLRGDRPSAALSWWEHTRAAWEAGSLTVFLTNPFWLVKTRLQLQLEAAKRAHAPASTTSSVGPHASAGSAASADAVQPYRGMFRACWECGSRMGAVAQTRMGWRVPGGGGDSLHLVVVVSLASSQMRSGRFCGRRAPWASIAASSLRFSSSPMAWSRCGWSAGSCVAEREGLRSHRSHPLASSAVHGLRGDEAGRRRARRALGALSCVVAVPCLFLSLLVSSFLFPSLPFSSFLFHPSSSNPSLPSLLIHPFSSPSARSSCSASRFARLGCRARCTTWPWAGRPSSSPRQ